MVGGPEGRDRELETPLTKVGVSYDIILGGGGGLGISPNPPGTHAPRHPFF